MTGLVLAPDPPHQAEGQLGQEGEAGEEGREGETGDGRSGAGPSEPLVEQDDRGAQGPEEEGLDGGLNGESLDDRLHHYQCHLESRDQRGRCVLRIRLRSVLLRYQGPEMNYFSDIWRSLTSVSCDKPPPFCSLF